MRGTRCRPSRDPWRAGFPSSAERRPSCPRKRIRASIWSSWRRSICPPKAPPCSARPRVRGWIGSGPFRGRGATPGRAGKPPRVLERLRERGFVYDAEGAAWFRSTAFGDDKDRVLVKSDGEATYFVNDIAHHVGK